MQNQLLLNFHETLKGVFDKHRGFGHVLSSMISLHASTYSSRLHVRWSIPWTIDSRNLQPRRQLKTCSQDSVGLTTQNGMWINMLFKGCGNTSSFRFLPLGRDFLILGLNTFVGSKWDNRSHSHHRRKCLLDCFGGQLDANTRISTGYAQNLPDHWD